MSSHLHSSVLVLLFSQTEWKLYPITYKLLTLVSTFCLLTVSSPNCYFLSLISGTARLLCISTVSLFCSNYVPFSFSETCIAQHRSWLIISIPPAFVLLLHTGHFLHSFFFFNLTSLNSFCKFSFNCRCTEKPKWSANVSSSSSYGHIFTLSTNLSTLSRSSFLALHH